MILATVINPGIVIVGIDDCQDMIFAAVTVARDTVTDRDFYRGTLMITTVISRTTVRPAGYGPNGSPVYSAAYTVSKRESFMRTNRQIRAYLSNLRAPNGEFTASSFHGHKTAANYTSLAI